MKSHGLCSVLLRLPLMQPLTFFHTLMSLVCTGLRYVLDWTLLSLSSLASLISSLCRSHRGPLMYYTCRSPLTRFDRHDLLHKVLDRSRYHAL